MSAPAEPHDRTLIDLLLEEQGRLTAVDLFSRQHDLHEFPLQQKYYRNLIPLQKPGAGEQYGFEVDLDNCSGCKACVVACHSLNGLDENETWRKAGAIVGRNHKLPFQQTVTTACHHCVDPGCLKGCPVEAYEKDFSTGIVRHLDDQCIGCQYCSWTCPYDVPQYSAKRGIVRKCDMCHGRLAEGEAPACVQACPNGAIAIRVVSQQAMRDSAHDGVFLPTTAPDPRLTIPTTRYLSKRPLPKFMGWPEPDLKPQAAHTPLIAMLLLTQMSVGILLFTTYRSMVSPPTDAFAKTAILIGTAAGQLGLIASVFHLGRPLHAWKSFLGWRHSWLSREVISFGAYGAATMALAGASILSLNNFVPALGVIAAALGMISVFASAMVYHATHRDFWHLKFTAFRFFGTPFVLGTAALWWIADSSSPPSGRWFAGLLIFATMAKLGAECAIFKHLDQGEENSLWRTARLLTTKLRRATSFRLLGGSVGGILLPFAWLTGSVTAAIPLTSLAICICGEVAERYLFFAAVAPTKMPGEN